MSHQLEFHAKAAMVLHDDSNGLAHHFVAHLKHQDIGFAHFGAELLGVKVSTRYSNFKTNGSASP